MTANPLILQMWAQRTKCWSCKRRFDKPVLLPVKNPKRGEYQPNYNTEFLFHIKETHGIWPEAVQKMIFNSIYGIESTMQNVFGETL